MGDGRGWCKIGGEENSRERGLEERILKEMRREEMILVYIRRDETRGGEFRSEEMKL